uniref:Proline dehydrogenase n=1 Tax=Rhinopithecus bieti TaxID=61621 RepID=A0A2K6JQ97_RHIBE
MALRRLLPALRPYIPRFAPLSTAPAVREQPAAGPGALPERGSAKAVRPPVPAVDFGNAQEAYRSRRTWELARSLLVLRLCAWPALLARHEQLLYVSRKLLGQRLFNKLMKMTFYGHFVAGEDQESIQPLLRHNRAFGVGAILDYGVEEDLSPEEAEHKEMESCTSAVERDGSGTNKRDKQYQAHRAFGDRRNGVISARTYFYANEAKCDSHMETFLRCIEASGGAPSLLAIPPPLETNQKWIPFSQKRHQRPMGGGSIKCDVAKMGIASRAEIEDWFTAETLGVSGTVDLLDWGSLIDSRTKLSKHLVVPNAQVTPPLLGEAPLSRQMDVLCQGELSLPRAETYFQLKPLIFNTYQCYLKDAYDNVTLGVELRVRGTYLAQERACAAEIGYEDPINPTYEATNAMYHRCLDFVLEELKHNAKAKVMVASHNEDTVRFTLRRMEELRLHPADHQVYFGQLLGMCDQISFPLGHASYPVYKYVPYGPVMEVLPYLSRRALENSSLMKGARREQQLLWLELLQRLRNGSLFRRPA